MIYVTNSDIVLLHCLNSHNFIGLFVTLQSVSQTVMLLPDPLPGIRVEITPVCEKYVK